MTNSLIDEIRKALKGEKKSEFIDQILKEKALYDALKEAGYVPTTEDVQERARLRPEGILSLVEKINLVDLISEITTIKNIANIANTANVDLIDLINRINEITTIGSIASPVDPYSLTSKTKVLDKIAFTYNADGTVETVKGYEGASLKYTLTFTWTAGSLTNIVRT